jgi:hypothetical protein
MDRRFLEMDERWQAASRVLGAEPVAAIDRCIGGEITTQTRMLIISFFVALVAIAGLAFGLN